MKHNMRKVPVITGALFALALCTGCARRVASAQAPPVPQVDVVSVTQRDVRIYGEWVGTLEGYVDAQIQPHVTGYVIRQDYREGAPVAKDQVLFEIDPRPFQAVLDQARAQLAADQAQLGKVKLDVARDVPEAQAKAIPQSQLDNDRQALLADQAAVQAGRAAVEQAELNVGYTKVRSLVSGIAGIATVQVGNLVGPSSVLTSVSQVNPIKVYFPVSEQEYLRMAGGAGAIAAFRNPLQITLSDGAIYSRKGRVLFADRQVDPQTGTIRIVGSFPNPRDLLRPGQYARVRALTETLKNALLVPQSAVSQLQGMDQVAVVGPDNLVRIQTVQIGPTQGTMWVITSGLKLGERVVRDGTQLVRSGEKVNPRAVATPPAGGR